ncbi:GTPase IMAP family member 8-like [Vanacampus margaritifer]
MADEQGTKDIQERRLVVIGPRQSGKSSSANTILRKERFECGRIRTAELEARHEIVKSWNLLVVDTPGWKNASSLREISERDKQQLKLCASKYPPGPHAFLIVIPTHSSFSFNQRETVQEHMKLLGERAWRYSMVLFTFGDYLGKKTIEQHIESEGVALTWLVDKCRNRYHMFNNKDKSNSSQVIQLMEKIDHMVYENDNSFYMLDKHMLHTIKKTQEEVAQKAEQRWSRALGQSKKMEMIVSETEPIQELRIILLGSQFVGKTSVGNTILGMKEDEEARTMLCQVRQGSVGWLKITVVDTPGWQKGFPACDTTEMIKDEILHSMFKCLPGPHVFLLVIDADASFNSRHLEAATTHMELLGENVWEHTVVVFSHGDWLGSHRIEEYIESEGNAMQSLVERCGNRYQVLDNVNADDSSQVDKLLEKIVLTLAENEWQHFTPNEKMLKGLKEKEKRVEIAAQLRSQANFTRTLKGPVKTLNKLRILLLGEKMSGKTTIANYLLQSKVFPAKHNEGAIAREAHIAGRQVTVVDTPGWYNELECTSEQDQEIVQGLTLSPAGFDAVLIVLSMDCKFDQANQDALEDHIKLFGDNIWNHTMVLFKNVCTLADRPLEEYIEREHRALRWLVDKCGNRYHCLNMTDKNDVSQHFKLFKKIEDMSAKNQGCLFNPRMKDIYLRIEEKFQKKKIKNAIRHVIEQGIRSQTLKLFKDFKEKLEKLQQDVNEIAPYPLTLNAGAKAKAKKKSLLSNIEQQIEEMNRNIMKSNHQLRSSMDFGVPSMSGSTKETDKVLVWLSQLQVSTDQDLTLSLNFSESSGYRSQVLSTLDD